MAPQAAEVDVEKKLTLLRERLKRRAVDIEFDAGKRARTLPPKEVGDSMVSQDHCFMELFAGEAGLTQAVSRLGIPVFEPGEIRTGGRIAVGTDLLCKETFKKLKSEIK